MRNPSGATRCSRDPVTAQRRATLPVFGGIFGSTSTTFSRAVAGVRNSPCATGSCRLFGAAMAGIAIIANPNARRNREWPLAAQQLRKAAPGAAILETRGPEELAGVAKAVKAQRPRVVAIAGGDGTVTHAVTALSGALGDDLPPLALLGGRAPAVCADGSSRAARWRGVAADRDLRPGLLFGGGGRPRLAPVPARDGAARCVPGARPHRRSPQIRLRAAAAPRRTAGTSRPA